jgi:hypothetical protein
MIFSGDFIYVFFIIGCGVKERSEANKGRKLEAATATTAAEQSATDRSSSATSSDERQRQRNRAALAAVIAIVIGTCRTTVAEKHCSSGKSAGRRHSRRRRSMPATADPAGRRVREYSDRASAAVDAMCSVRWTVRCPAVDQGRNYASVYEPNGDDRRCLRTAQK